MKEDKRSTRATPHKPAGSRVNPPVDSISEKVSSQESPFQDSPPKNKITGVLYELKDDIVASSDPRDGGTRVTFEPRSGLDSVYIEQSSGRFKIVPKSVIATSPLADRSSSEPTYQYNAIETPLDLAILIQYIWRKIGYVCFGILGGVGLFQLLLVMSLDTSNRNSAEYFSDVYHNFAYIAPHCFYILPLICLLSIFDWLDMAHINVKHCVDCMMFRPAWLLMLLYFALLVIGIITVSYDDLFVLSIRNDSYIRTHEKKRLEQFQYDVVVWSFLNMTRCFLAVAGWCIVAMLDIDDLFLEHLQAMKKYEPQDKISIP